MHRNNTMKHFESSLLSPPTLKHSYHRILQRAVIAALQIVMQIQPASAPNVVHALNRDLVCDYSHIIIDLLWCQAHIIEHHQKSSLPHVLCKVKDVNFNGSRVKTCGEVETIDYTLEIVGNVKFPSCSYDDARGDMTVQCWTMYGPISVRLDAPVCTCHRSNVSVNSNEQSLMMSFLAHKILVVMDNSGFTFNL